MLKKHGWIVVLFIAIAMVFVGCPGGDPEVCDVCGNDPCTCGGEPVMETVFSLSDYIEELGLSAGVISFTNANNDLSPVIKPAGVPAVEVIDLDGGGYGLKITSSEGWGPGIDILNAQIPGGFRAGDQLVVSGKSVTKASGPENWANARILMHFDIGNDTPTHPIDSFNEGDPFEWDITLTAAQVSMIQANEQQAIRIGTRGSGSVIEIHEITLSREAERATVTFVVGGGAANIVKHAYLDASLGSDFPAAPVREGFRLAGWFTQENGAGTAFTSTTTVGANITVYAHWIQQVTITFDLAGGDGEFLPITVDINTVVHFPGSPEKEGAFFEAWFNGNVEWDFDDPVTASMTLVAVYDELGENERVVSFSPDGGDPVPHQQRVTIGNPILQPETMTKANYTFAGWFTNEDLTGSAWNFATPLPNITGIFHLYAKWELNKYIVTFTGGEQTGAIVPTPYINIEHGSTINVPSNPTAAGFRFINWRNAAGDAVWVFGTGGTQVTSDTTLYATWEEVVSINITVDGTPQSVDLLPQGTATVEALGGGNGYRYSTNAGTWDVPWVKFAVDLGSNVLADFDKVTFTLTGVEGDTGWKNTALLAANTLSATGEPSAALSLPTQMTNFPQYTSGTVNMTLTINTAKAATVTSNVIEVSINLRTGANTVWEISNIAFILGETDAICGSFPCVCVFNEDTSVTVTGLTQTGSGSIDATFYDAIEAAKAAGKEHGYVIVNIVNNGASNVGANNGSGHFGTGGSPNNIVTTKLLEPGDTDAIKILLEQITVNGLNTWGGVAITGYELWLPEAP